MTRALTLSLALSTALAVALVKARRDAREGWRAAAWWQQYAGNLGEKLREAEKECEYWIDETRAQVEVICGLTGDEPEPIVVFIP